MGMTEKKIKIMFVKKASVELADNEKISLWDNESYGASFISTKEGSICLIGCWKVSLIGNLLGSGVLGAIFIRPFFMHGRMELLPVEHVERVIIDSKRSGKKVYHIFQEREAGMSEVHTFKATTEADEAAIEELIASVIPVERIRVG
jgi:hypothetical protein